MSVLLFSKSGTGVVEIPVLDRVINFFLKSVKKKRIEVFQGKVMYYIAVRSACNMLQIQQRQAGRAASFSSSYNLR